MTRPHLGHPDDRHDVLYWGTYDNVRTLYQRPYEMVGTRLTHLWRGRIQLALEKRKHLGGLCGYIDGYSAWSWGDPEDPDVIIIAGYVPYGIALERFAEVFPGVDAQLPQKDPSHGPR